MPTLAKWLLGVTGILLMGLLVTPLFVHREICHKATCLNNTRQIGIAVAIYITDNDDRFPPSDAWAEVIDGYVKNPDIFRCPTGDWPGRYAFNANLDRVDAHILSAPDHTPMIFDALAFEVNPAGGLERVDYRHEGGAMFTRTDSSAKYYRKEEMDQLVWKVPLGPFLERAP